MKPNTNFKSLSVFLFCCTVFFSCSKKMDTSPLENQNSALLKGNITVSGYTDLVTTNWKGIVWDAYNKDWNNVATYDDGQEIAAAGIKWARLWITAGTADAKNDSMVSRCSSNNIKIVACYVKSNPAKDLGDSTQQSEQVTTLKNFVNRYKASIKYWEIGNENNLISYWNITPGAYVAGNNPAETGRGSSDSNSIYNAGVRRYVQWLHLAYDAIKATDPSATVILGGVSSYIMSDFMNRFMIEKGYLYCDEVAYHPYAETSDLSISRLNDFKAKLTLWPFPKNGSPIWITEVGFNDTDENLKANNLTELMPKLIQDLPYSRPIFWYIIHDNSFALIQQNVSGSIVTTTHLPAYYSYQALNQSWSYNQTHLGNLITNPGFEANGASQTPTGWSESSNVAASYSDASNAHTGTYKLSHYLSSAYQAYTYQTKTGLLNGIYTLKAFIARGGTQSQCQMEAKDFGGTQINLTLPITASWTQITIPNINVTNNTCTIGFYSNASANAWINIDDVEFFKQ